MTFLRVTQGGVSAFTTSPPQVIKYTIIIPVKAVNDYIRETVPHIQALTRGDWEVIILPNEQSKDEWEDIRIRIVASGRVGPAEKRDIGADLAKGAVLVFLDDDSYPDPDLLKVADRHFEDHTVVALGGPAMTPPNDSFWQRVSGAVFISKLSGGSPERYLPVGEERPVDDWPSVNFMIRRSEFLKVGGFSTSFWPGEDTYLCNKLKVHGLKILYSPKLIVWHHRRSGLVKHIKQVSNYGLHRGHFRRIGLENSMSLKYAAPSLMVVYLMVALAAPWIFGNINYALLIAPYLFILLLACIDIWRKAGMRISMACLPYIVCTHVSYGFGYMLGITKVKLISRLR